MKPRMLAAAIVAILVIAACATAAQPRVRAARIARPKAVGRVLKQLDLTKAQKVEIRAIVKDSRISARAIKQNTTLDRDAKRAQLRQLRRQTMVTIKALLTPEQQQKLDDLKARRRAKNGLRPA